MEGYLFGIPAIAFSQVEKGWLHIDAAAHKARELVLQMMKQKLGAEATRVDINKNRDAPWLLNVNIPNLPLAELKPMKVCRLGKRHAAEAVITQQNPRGDTMYWIGGAGPAKDDSEGTDFHATTLGHIAMTPLKTDLTEHDHLLYWAQALAQMHAQTNNQLQKTAASAP